jgi:hypothetical protein
LFDEGRFRPADVPILMSDARKIQELGFNVTKTLEDIIRDQVNYYLNPENRRLVGAGYYPLPKPLSSTLSAWIQGTQPLQ